MMFFFLTKEFFFYQTSSTFAAVLADVSININPCSRANASPSSFCTSRRAKRSLKQIINHSFHINNLTIYFQ
jgi:hypothetical protein